jgi:hypothetical protein
MADGVSLDVAGLLAMTQEELDERYRASPPGPVPDGSGEGSMLLDVPGRLRGVAARLIHLLAWQGKVFDAAKGELRNRVTPLGVQAVAAEVYLGPSRFDGGQSVVLDYSRRSLVARPVRDELREVAPGLYLGFAYVGGRRLASFALAFPVSGR